VRADQVLAIAKAFDKLIDYRQDGGGRANNDNSPAVQPRQQ